MGRSDPSKPPKRRVGYTDEDIKAAMDKARGINGVKVSATQAALEHGIPPTTLSDYLRGKSSLGAVLGSKTLLPRHLEEQLEQYAMNGMTRPQIMKKAAELAIQHNISVPQSWRNKGTAGKEWYEGFRLRHPSLTLISTKRSKFIQTDAMTQVPIQHYTDSNTEGISLKIQPEHSDFVENIAENDKSVSTNTLDSVNCMETHSLESSSGLNAENVDQQDCAGLINDTADNNNCIKTIIDASMNKTVGTSTEGLGSTMQCLCCPLKIQTVTEYQQHLITFHKMDGEFAIRLVSKRIVVQEIMDTTGTLLCRNCGHAMTGGSEPPGPVDIEPEKTSNTIPHAGEEGSPASQPKGAVEDQFVISVDPFNSEEQTDVKLSPETKQESMDTQDPVVDCTVSLPIQFKPSENEGNAPESDSTSATGTPISLHCEEVPDLLGTPIEITPMEIKQECTEQDSVMEGLKLFSDLANQEQDVEKPSDGSQLKSLLLESPTQNEYEESKSSILGENTGPQVKHLMIGKVAGSESSTTAIQYTVSNSSESVIHEKDGFKYRTLIMPCSAPGSNYVINDEPLVMQVYACVLCSKFTKLWPEFVNHMIMSHPYDRNMPLREEPRNPWKKVEKNVGALMTKESGQQGKETLKCVVGYGCTIPNCNNRSWIQKYLSFYGYPLDDAPRLKLWLDAIPRDDWTPSVHSKICSVHFLGGKKTDEPGSSGYIPVIFPDKSASLTPEVISKLIKVKTARGMKGTQKKPGPVQLKTNTEVVQNERGVKRKIVSVQLLRPDEIKKIKSGDRIIKLGSETNVQTLRVNIPAENKKRLTLDKRAIEQKVDKNADALFGNENLEKMPSEQAVAKLTKEDIKERPVPQEETLCEPTKTTGQKSDGISHESQNLKKQPSEQLIHTQKKSETIEKSARMENAKSELIKVSEDYVFERWGIPYKKMWVRDTPYFCCTKCPTRLEKWDAFAKHSNTLCKQSYVYEQAGIKYRHKMVENVSYFCCVKCPEQFETWNTFKIHSDECKKMTVQKLKCTSQGSQGQKKRLSEQLEPALRGGAINEKSARREKFGQAKSPEDSVYERKGIPYQQVRVRDVPYFCCTKCPARLRTWDSFVKHTNKWCKQLREKHIYEKDGIKYRHKMIDKVPYFCCIKCLEQFQAWDTFKIHSANCRKISPQGRKPGQKRKQRKRRSQML